MPPESKPSPAQRYAKALVALAAALVVMFGGDALLDGIDVEALEAVVASLLVAGGVAAGPRNHYWEDE